MTTHRTPLTTARACRPTPKARALLLTLLVGVAGLGGCVPTPTPAPRTAAEVRPAHRHRDLPLRRIFPDAAMITEGGVEELKASTTFGPDYRYQVETGALHGVKYQVYKSDGSGTVQGLPGNTLGADDDYGTNWHVGIDVDLIEDTHRARLRRGDLVIVRTSGGRTFVRVGHKHFPRSPMVVRIDDHAPIRAREDRGFTPEQVERILEQLRTGEVVTTRYMQWPYERYRDDRWTIFGFQEALTISDWLVEHLDRQRYAAIQRDD